MKRLFYIIQDQMYLDKEALIAMARNLGIQTDGIDSLLSLKGKGVSFDNPNFVQI